MEVIFFIFANRIYKRQFLPLLGSLNWKTLPSRQVMGWDRSPDFQARGKSHLLHVFCSHYSFGAGISWPRNYYRTSESKRTRPEANVTLSSRDWSTTGQKKLAQKDHFHWKWAQSKKFQSSLEEESVGATKPRIHSSGYPDNRVIWESFFLGV